MLAELLTDWLTISVTNREDPREVIRDILRLDPSLFEDTYGVVRGFYKGLEHGHICVGYEPFGFAKGVCVSMSGQGCRTYESLGQSLEALLERVHADPAINVTRWDIACDIKSGLFDMEMVLDKLAHKGLRSHCKKRKAHIDYDNEDMAGTTVYIGSTQSEYFIRIYDKAKKEYDKVREPEKYNSPWIRVELVLKKQYAENAVAELTNRDDLGIFVAEMINGHMAFIERDDSNISRCSMCDWWAEFLQCVTQVKLWSKGEVLHSFEKSLDHVLSQYAPTLAMLYEGLGSFAFFDRIIYNGKRRMSDKHKSIVSSYKRCYA